MKDDTVIDDPNMKEQATLELLKSKADKVYGFSELEENAQHFNDGDVMFVNISRDSTELGILGGAEFSSRMVKSVKGGGRISIMFEGYAADPRPLFAVPEVREFCQGMILGGGNQQETEDFLSLLVDEIDLAESMGLEAACEVAGSLWVCAHAFPNIVFFEDDDSETGFSRDVHKNHLLRALLVTGNISEEDLANLGAGASEHVNWGEC
jgi:hypothetical protein